MEVINEMMIKKKNSKIRSILIFHYSDAFYLEITWRLGYLIDERVNDFFNDVFGTLSQRSFLKSCF